MKLTLYLLFGSAFILVGILALYVGVGLDLLLLPRDGELASSIRELQSWVFLAFYVGFGILAGIWPLHTWSPDGHASAPTAVSMLHAGVLMKLGAYGVMRLGLGLLPDGAMQWVWLVGAIACVNIVYGALSAMAPDGSQVRHRLLVRVPHGRGHARHGDPHGERAQRLRLPDVRPRHHDRALLRPGGPRLREGALASHLLHGRLRPDDAGHRDGLHLAGLSSLGLPATAGFVAEFLTFLGAWQSPFSWWLFPGVIGAFLTSVYVLRVAKQIFWGPKSADPHFQHLPDAQGPEWAALIILVFTLVLFGVAPGIALGPVDTATVPLLLRLGVLQ